jgi:hypothetical protein
LTRSRISGKPIRDASWILDGSVLRLKGVMGPINLRVRYRPIKIGWCVQENNLDEYRKALRLTHTLWGGRFNPIIPLGDPGLARMLVKTFRVDCLFCIGQSPAGDALLLEFKHLLWPSFHEGLFIQGSVGPMATFLDVSHPVRHFYEAYVRDRDKPSKRGLMFRWNPADPLADLFLATFGAYPVKDEIGLDYDGFVREHLAAQEIEIRETVSLPTGGPQQLTPSRVTAFDLRSDLFAWGRDTPGLYYGESGDFTDLVNFWNLRASGIEVLFYDRAFHERLYAMSDHHLATLRARPKDPRWLHDDIAIWNKSYDIEIDLTSFGTGLTRSAVSPAVWNGLNIKPPVMGFEEQSVLGTASENGGVTATFELPAKPFYDDVRLHTQNVVVSVHPLVTTENVVLKPPFFPRLNEYYGREAHFEYNKVRSEREGIGIVTGITQSSLTIRALDVRSLVKRVFGASGISAKPSPAGLVGLRLIEQMGGLQGCRVFKIAGVRELIHKYSPERSFTRGGAVNTIRRVDPISGKPQFSQYESLYIERRAVRPEGAFSYLLQRGVFRPGLRLLCPNCELESWIHLDEIRTVSRCEYCGRDFNITGQLKDRDWAFRRSGLFGKDDHQRGGIPVALTLQQLQTVLHSHLLAYTTGTELEPNGADIQKCETDFVLLAESVPERTLQIAIGECKGSLPITEDDVRNLALVADALAAGGDCEAFVVFAKTSPFTSEEVERCKAAQGKYERRVILLSDRELEPYFIYERADKEFEIYHSAVTLEDMVRATENIYFDPKPKSQPEGPSGPPIAPDAAPGA